MIHIFNWNISKNLWNCQIIQLISSIFTSFLEIIIKKVLYLLESFGFHQDNLEGVIANVSVFDSQPVRAGPQANSPGVRGGEPAGGGQPKPALLTVSTVLFTPLFGNLMFQTQGVLNKGHIRPQPFCFLFLLFPEKKIFITPQKLFH